jgi:hypothetical protein
MLLLVWHLVHHGMVKVATTPRTHFPAGECVGFTGIGFALGSVSGCVYVLATAEVLAFIWLFGAPDAAAHRDDWADLPCTQPPASSPLALLPYILPTVALVHLLALAPPPSRAGPWRQPELVGAQVRACAPQPHAARSRGLCARAAQPGAWVGTVL